MQGTVAIQGGYFEDNQTAAADGYVYKDNVQTVDGITYNYEVGVHSKSSCK